MKDPPNVRKISLTLLAERGPRDDLVLRFEAVSKLDKKEREAVETMIAGVLHMHDTKRWQATTQASKSAKGQS